MANSTAEEEASVTSMGVVAGDNPLHHSLLLLMTQIIVIICFSRIIATLFKPLRQPRVVAEIIGGILLGPTAVGRIPGFSDTIFPASSLNILETVAEFGLMFFLFLVGLELDLRVLRKSGTSAMYVAAAGIGLPFILGVGVSILVFKSMNLDEHSSFGPFVLFMGVSLSITAFPVLARILAERKILNTQIGQVAVSAAAMNDVVAWALLALAVAVTNSGSSPLVIVWVLLSGLVYLLVMFGLVRPLVYALANYKDPIPEVVIAITFLLMIISSYATDAMGIHVIFGAFIMGLVIPKDGPFAGLLIEKVEDFVSILLLPLYFTSSGLKTDLDSIASLKAVGILVLVTLTAILGKVGGTVLVTRFQGMDMRSSLSLGVLMSTKGLVELIVLNIGLSKGVINNELFATLVVMALITTAMTTPTLMWLYKPARDVPAYNRRVIEAKNAKASVNEKLRMLVCVHGMENVPGMMNLIHMSKGRRTRLLQVDALHLVEFSERSSAIRMAALANADDSPSDEDYEDEGTRVLIGDAVNMALKTFSRVNRVKTRVSLTVSRLDTMHEDVCSAAAATRANLIVLPFHKYPGPDGSFESRGAGFLQVNFRVMENSPCSAAILADRGLGMNIPAGQMHQVMVLFFGGPDDREALLFGQRMHAHGGVKLTVVHCILKPKHQHLSSLSRLNSADLVQYLPDTPQFYGLSIRRCKKALLKFKHKVVKWLRDPWNESSEKVEVVTAPAKSDVPSSKLDGQAFDESTQETAAEGIKAVKLSMDELETENEKQKDMKILAPVLAAAKQATRLASVNEETIADSSSVSSKSPKVLVVDMSNPMSGLEELFSGTNSYSLIIAGLHLGPESAIQRTGNFDCAVDSAEHDQGLGPVGNMLLSKELKLRTSVLVIRQHRPASDESLGGMTNLKAVPELA
ncbi:K+:H+ antiporter [Marchantia polymorpha subsp. ruderalis]|uniref:Cation/H+ exchanger domain-containing protein n=2 Tax=Marchantia polymorpha TaxID=3197 RepID=A0AAF6BTU1_MARPO|nr:hypothetical protein MARPO_0045s0114 [Marchantia polymorpha]BBN15425.1 hypothetical protein Mp_6g19490 [Marchantia polymorpha subsp. ruderalis]|eukprot:PTQ39463.1 hypothetical protein MARPO_0045s0114 [Marchantia polymorpha]